MEKDEQEEYLQEYMESESGQRLKKLFDEMDEKRKRGEISDEL